MNPWSQHQIGDGKEIVKLPTFSNTKPPKDKSTRQSKETMK